MAPSSKKVTRNPRAEFGSADRIVADPNLSESRKILLLMDWRGDLLELQRAEGENMQGATDVAGDVAVELKHVTDALTSLGVDPVTGSRGST